MNGDPIYQNRTEIELLAPVSPSRTVSENEKKKINTNVWPCRFRQHLLRIVPSRVLAFDSTMTALRVTAAVAHRTQTALSAHRAVALTPRHEQWMH